MLHNSHNSTIGKSDSLFVTISYSILSVPSNRKKYSCPYKHKLELLEAYKQPGVFYLIK